jgi:hypothetical protein
MHDLSSSLHSIAALFAGLYVQTAKFHARYCAPVWPAYAGDTHVRDDGEEAEIRSGQRNVYMVDSEYSRDPSCP